ncbi:hypothetical protein [Pseudokineococcus sp. 1T1Z-3]|uniref:hypothetical protein n=1 Tax=Pseudokineococcus sp. 1T1Z-3 TaxID=3132745 RepID=UPI00309AA16F
MTPDRRARRDIPARPTQVRSAQVSPAELGSTQVRPAQVRPAHVRPAQVLGAATAAGLLAALVAGWALSGDERAGAQEGAHHGVLPVGGADGTAADQPLPADGLGAGLATTPDGRVVHDHGDLEVTVMLAADGETLVAGPVEPGALVTVVNHTSADQLVVLGDAPPVEVPLVSLVALRAPDEPGTYDLVSRTDPGVAAEVVVAERASGQGGAAVVTPLDEE